jgi:hypothetical protein
VGYMASQIVETLRAKAKIEIDEAALAAVSP